MTRRPYYLNLLQIHLPIGGWVSILHRASGVLLSLLVPVLLYGLMRSLQSVEGFAQVQGFLSGGIGWLVGLLLTWALLHHFLAGLRHLGLDIGWGEGRARARQTAWLVLATAIVLTLLVVARGL
ncbi:MAG: succinate dehydrogenase, cytochrome b556 subunit [Betaproteobacteria bacterium]|nr:succinate dehydrogenase, cytochrome b556 subunit [Betaproteobacteria bacterium]